MTPFAIRPLESHDITAILEIQNSCREAARWSEHAYRAFGRAGENAWVADRNGNIAGFLLARGDATEIEVLNLAVDPNLRRQGIGGALLDTALLWGAVNGAQRVFLEVRSSNTAARRFYEAHGFSIAGTRRNYYRAPDDDAVLLTRVISGDDSPTSRL